MASEFAEADPDGALPPDYRDAALVAMGFVAAPLFVVDPAGAVMLANTAGEAALRSASALRRVKGRLTFRRKGDARSLMETLERVAETRQPEILRLRARPGNLNFILTIASVPRQPLLVVGVADLRPQTPIAAGWTARLFGFSPQGAELAEALFQGLTLAEFSGRSGVTIGGVRTRVKKLLSATNCRSQAELIAVLLRASMVSLISDAEIK